MTTSIFEFRRGLRVLALSPHADDIELGCGATLLYLKKYCQAKIFNRLFCKYVLERTRGAGEEIEKRIWRHIEAKLASDMMGCDNSLAYEYEDRKFPADKERLQSDLKKLRDDYNPELIFAPRLDDNHQDHASVAEAAIRVFRDGQAIWHYEIKQFGQREFDANVFVNVSSPSRFGDPDPAIDPSLRDRLGQWNVRFEAFRDGDANKDTLAHLKLFILQECMASQAGKAFLDPELILGTMRLRAAQCGKGIKYAEAFYAKSVINLYNDGASKDTVRTENATGQLPEEGDRCDGESTEELSGQDTIPTKSVGE